MAAFGSPRTLGRYTLLTELASSHLGPLWLVKDDEGAVAMARRVRLGSRPDQAMVDRISEAAFTATEIDQALVAKVTEVLLQGSEIGVIQAYAEGTTLRTIQRSATTRRKPMPSAVAVRLAHDLLEALSALHGYAEELGELGSFLFGGVNPDSLLVTTAGRLHVLDPLVAGAASTIDSIRNHSDRLAYTSPEQNEEGATVDARTDVFCAGTLLWELLAERRLFMGMGKSVAQKVKALKIPRLDQLEFKDRPALPSSIADVVARALHRDPTQRYQTTAEMRAELESVGLAAARPEQVAQYVEGVAEFELRKQREACATPGASHAASPELRAAGLSRKLPAVIPRREMPSKPDVEVPRGALPEAAPSPPKRAAKQTLLGLAPPKPIAAPQVSEPERTIEPTPAAEPATTSAEQQTSRASDEPPTLVADVASIARALEESQRQGDATRKEKGKEHTPVDTAPSGALAVSPPPGALDTPDAPADDQAFDAELEAVYDNPVPVRMASIDPKMGDVVSDPVQPIPGNGGVAAALADALAPVEDQRSDQPESTDLGDLLTPATSEAAQTGTDDPTAGAQAPDAKSPADGAKPESDPEGNSPAKGAAAVPLIHDQRFGGPGPRGARAKTSFMGGILVGAAVAFVLVMVLVVVLLVVLLRRGSQELAAPADVVSGAPAATSAAVPPTTTASTSASAHAPEPTAAPEEPEEPEEPGEPEEPENPEQVASDSPPPPAAPRPRPRPKPKPKPNPKPSFVPDEI